MAGSILCRNATITPLPHERGRTRTYISGSLLLRTSFAMIMNGEWYLASPLGVYRSHLCQIIKAGSILHIECVYRNCLCLNRYVYLSPFSSGFFTSAFVGLIVPFFFCFSSFRFVCFCFSINCLWLLIIWVI